MTFAVAIGKFDALHRGHFALVERAAALGRPTLLTFSGQAESLGWEARLPLVAPDDRARVLAEWSAVLGVPIATHEMSFAEVRSLAPAEFFAHLRALVPLGAVVVGGDFRFGRNRAGDAGNLAELADMAGIASAIVPAVEAHGEVISSSRIRAALDHGDVAIARLLLGRPHRLLGTVARGDGRGRTLGFPTANCAGYANLMPAPGVYAAWAVLDGVRIPAAVNIGRLPTIGPDRPLTVEAHLIGWQGDCYDARLGLDFISRLRPERRFPSLAALTAQLAEDVRMAQAALAAGEDRKIDL
jgi:riboflavin kinase/FMN adenylyltransferase